VFVYAKEQEVFDISGIKIGGQPGEYPTLLLGTIFYGKQFKNLDKGALSEAKRLIELQEEYSDLTKNPGLLDVYIKDEKDLEKEIDLVLGSTDKPFSVDISESALRASALKYLAKVGALDRIIYNSINLGITDDEIKALAKHTPEAAILLAYNPKDLSVNGRLDILKTGANMLCEGKYSGGLLDVAKEVGIEKTLLDTASTPFNQHAADSLRAIPVFKSEFGLPTGCALHNTLEAWDWMKSYRKQHKDVYETIDVLTAALIPEFSGDYTIYGPIDNAPKVFPAVAFVDKLVAEGGTDFFGTEVKGPHPYLDLE